TGRAVRRRPHGLDGARRRAAQARGRRRPRPHGARAGARGRDRPGEDRVMAVETASLIIKVDSRGAKSASADLDKLTAGAGKAEKATGALTGAWKVLTTVAASAALAKPVTSYIRMADASANMAARLRLATKSQEEFNAAHRATF